MDRWNSIQARADARSFLLLGLAIVPIVLTGWFSFVQWRDAGQELREIDASVEPVVAAYRAYEMFDRLGRSELLIEAMAVEDPPEAVAELVVQDQAVVSAELDAALEAYLPYQAVFADRIGQTEELARSLVDTAIELSRVSVEEYELGDPVPRLVDLLLRPARDGLYDMVPVFVGSATPEEQLLGALMVLDHDHDLDVLRGLRGELETLRLAELRLPVWDATNQAWSLELSELPDGLRLSELMELGSLTSDDNPLAPPLNTLVEVGTAPSPERDAAIVAALANDRELYNARAEAFDAFDLRTENRSAELRRGRLVAMVAGLAMTALAVVLLRLVIKEVAERRRVASAHAETLNGLAEIANTDALTGLRNRRWLDGALPRMLEQRGPDEEVAVAYLDVDRFKAINDVWGHHNGDTLLRVVAQRLQAAAAKRLPTAELVRFGGDEFVGVATVPYDVADQELEDVGAILLDVFAEAVNLDGRQHEIQSSVGIAMSATDSTMHSLLVDADFAMRRAKRAGRGRVVIDRGDEGRVSELVHALPAAMADGEITMHLQPVVSAETGDTHHYEALARWTRASGEQVSPTVFVQLVESFGLADDLTSVMLGHVADLHREIDLTLPRIWVNVSPVEFNGPDFANRILGRLEALGVPPNAIGIEMTERAAIGDIVGVEDELAQLREAGVQIAIDDFGAGYSPLGHLRDLPVDTLKIDRSLVSDIDQDPGALDIVRGIIGFGRSLGLTLLGEGVETEEEFAVLRSQGVDLIQGWLTGRPGPALDIVRSTWPTVANDPQGSARRPQRA